MRTLEKAKMTSLKDKLYAEPVEVKKPVKKTVTSKKKK